MTYSNKEIEELLNLMAPYMQERVWRPFIKEKKKSLSYEVLEVDLDQVPLFINSDEPHVKELAQWRLEHNK